MSKVLDIYSVVTLQSLCKNISPRNFVQTATWKYLGELGRVGKRKSNVFSRRYIIDSFVRLTHWQAVKMSWSIMMYAPQRHRYLMGKNGKAMFGNRFTS